VDLCSGEAVARRGEQSLQGIGTSRSARTITSASGVVLICRAVIGWVACEGLSAKISLPFLRDQLEVIEEGLSNLSS